MTTELLTMNSHCSPKEKLRAVINCCKVIIRMPLPHISQLLIYPPFSTELLNTAENAAGADDFLPHLCIVVLRAYPPHMHSNIRLFTFSPFSSFLLSMYFPLNIELNVHRFISRYIGPNVLVSETLYYYTQVVSVISFIENLEAHHLNLTQPQFDRFVPYLYTEEIPFVFL